MACTAKRIWQENPIHDPAAARWKLAMALRSQARYVDMLESAAFDDPDHGDPGLPTGREIGNRYEDEIAEALHDLSCGGIKTAAVASAIAEFCLMAVSDERGDWSLVSEEIEALHQRLALRGLVSWLQDKATLEYARKYSCRPTAQRSAA